mgnify:CR=1 FL=1
MVVRNQTRQGGIFLTSQTRIKKQKGKSALAALAFCAALLLLLPFLVVIQLAGWGSGAALPLRLPGSVATAEAAEVELGSVPGASLGSTSGSSLGSSSHSSSPSPDCATAPSSLLFLLSLLRALPPDLFAL